MAVNVKFYDAKDELTTRRKILRISRSRGAQRSVVIGLFTKLFISLVGRSFLYSDTGTENNAMIFN